MDFFHFIFVPSVVQSFARISAFIKWVMRKLYKAIVRPSPFWNLNSICKKIPSSSPPPLTFAFLLPFNLPKVCPIAPLPHSTPPPHLNTPSPPKPPHPPQLNPPGGGYCKWANAGGRVMEEDYSTSNFTPPPNISNSLVSKIVKRNKIQFLRNIKSNKNIKVRQKKIKLNKK